MTEVRLTGGLKITRSSLEEIIPRVSALARDREPTDIHFITAHAVSIASQDSRYRSVMDSASILLPDSKWLEILTRVSRTPLTQVRGPDFFRGLLSVRESNALGHFFIAPSPLVLQHLLATIEEEFPATKVAGGIVAPYRPFEPSEIEALVLNIRSIENAVVWLGIGTPAQNMLARQLVDAGAGVVVGVGAAFEFLTGMKKEAPHLVSKIGMEWLFRFLSEPRRLWRRYTVDNIRFLIAFVNGELRRSETTS